MPMATRDADRLRQVRSFPQLVKYLRDELGWPIEQTNFEDLTFEWDPQELGIDAKSAAKIDEIKQLRPLESDQPWGIFFVKFEPKRLPIVALRRILGQLAIKKRASAKKADQRTWRADDLLFISAYGEGGDRQLSFAHFSAPDNERDIPTLRVLGWDGDDTALKLEHVAKTLSEKLAWPEDPDDVADWRAVWSSAFVLRPSEIIRTSKELAVKLAELAKGIRHRAEQLLELESDRGPLRRLFEAFKTTLLHDLKESDFADMYAQTITYGLFSAAVTGEGAGNRGVLMADDIATGAPITNPFLRELLASFLTVGGRKGKINFDELGVQEVVELLRSPDTHLADILRDFGNQTRDEDPVIHFYESFLKEYDKKRKVERGVFYTPQPVVSYIVRSVHELLQVEFGLEDGLASTVTWREIADRTRDLTIPKGTSPESPFVTILDPATGTATFLVESIDVIHKTMIARWKRERVPEQTQLELWNEYVPIHLLPRLYGYELMMAPYAIAHMKIGLKLLETGYQFANEERARVYLTNALEPAEDFSNHLSFDVPALAHEAHAVNAVKSAQRFTVIIGNPPYAKLSQNRGFWINRLMDRFKTTIKTEEIQRQALSDDYVKFFCLTSYQIEQSGYGVLGLITNNGYLDGPLFRDMRATILGLVPQILILNLNGDARRRAQTVVDENVFDIQQGVCIFLGRRAWKGENDARYASVIGTREHKYETLGRSVAHLGEGVHLSPVPPAYFLLPVKGSSPSEWRAGLPLHDVFAGGVRDGRALPFNGAALATRHDEFAIAFSKEELKENLRKFFDKRTSDVALRDHFRLCTSGHFNLGRARREVPLKEASASIRRILYRPFDWRWVLYHPLLIGESRPDVMRHLLRKNLALLSTRRVTGRPYDNVYVADSLVEYKAATHDRNTQVFPLFLYAPNSPAQQLALNVQEADRRPNLSNNVLIWSQRMKGVRTTEAQAAEAAFEYLYALLYSPTYRSRFAPELEQDYARLLVTAQPALFAELARMGAQLIALHLLESPALNSSQPVYQGRRGPEVERPIWSAGTVWLDKAQSAGFHGVPEEVWTFHIGGYQVCEKWLKDRKGRTLAAEDIRHYQRIVVALRETICIMSEIDDLIDKHGGWPGAFQQGVTAVGESAYPDTPALRRVAEPNAAYGTDDKAD